MIKLASRVVAAALPIVVAGVVAVGPAALAQQPADKKPPIIIPPPQPPPTGPVRYSPGPGGSNNKPRPALSPAPAGKGAPAAPGAAPAAPAAAPSPAAVAAAAKGPPPKPAPEMDQLKFFTGKWKCEGKQFASPVFGPEHPFTGTVEAKMDNDNFWQTWTYEEKASKQHQGFRVHGMWGWDASHSHFVRAGGDNRGNWDSANTAGFMGGRMIWSGELSGPLGRLTFHHTFTKKSDKEWTHALEIKGADSSWSPLEEATCKK